MITISPDILYEDTHVLVCVKPAGLATQSSRIGQPDMVSVLKNHLASNHKSASNINTKIPSGHAQAKEPYLGLIHRLDQPVSGIMVFAKTPFAAKELSRELQAKGFGKHYRALVTNRPSNDCGILEDYLVRDGRTNTSRICDKNTKGAKFARLSYHIVSNTHSECELDITLDTGRHHQIRVQLAHIGCPIIGDRKYGAHSSVSPTKEGLKLCSYRLEFTHPKTGKLMTFSLL